MKCQRERDGRKLTPSAIMELKRQTVKMREDGCSNQEVARLLDLHPSTTSKWWSAYKRGEDIFQKAKEGRPRGKGKRLDPEEERAIIAKLIDTTPKQLKFPFALWSREAVQTLIEHLTGKRLPLSTVGHYLQQWQFRAKRPIRRAYERKDAATKRWLEEEYPKIKASAKKEGAQIWWADEMASVSLPSYLRGYAPIGTHHKPILEHPAKRFKIDVVSAISPTGKALFALYEGAMNTDRFIDFLQKLIDSSNQKVYLITDNLRVHHAKAVKAWIKEHEDQIAIFYLPAYSPDLNPDEYLNQDFKRNAHKKEIPKNLEALKESSKNYLLSIQNDPQKVKNYFRHPKVRYAA